MKVVLVSDTHRFHDDLELPEGDMLIHAGDFCGHGSPVQVSDFARWLEGQDYKYKIVIAGNHDELFEHYPDARKLLEERGITYLQDSGTTIEGLYFWGSPWQPEFCNWAFNLPRGKALAKKWAMIPESVDVLITHGPPYSILDQIDKRNCPEHLGCHDLYDRVKIVKPKLHVFGHIHGSAGQEVRGDTLFVNASICDERYDPINPPIVVDLSELVGNKQDVG